MREAGALPNSLVVTWLHRSNRTFDVLRHVIVNTGQSLLKMTCCRTFCKISASVLVALAAVFAYFHLECQREEEAKSKTSTFGPFDPKQTDARDVPLKFCVKGTESELYLGIEIVLEQSAPCAVVKMVNFLGGGSDYAKLKGQTAAEPNKTVAKVTIRDARKQSPGTFHDTGEEETCKIVCDKHHQVRP